MIVASILVALALVVALIACVALIAALLPTWNIVSQSERYAILRRRVLVGVTGLALAAGSVVLAVLAVQVSRPK